MDVQGTLQEEVGAKAKTLLPKNAAHADVYGLCYLAFKMQESGVDEWRKPEDWLSEVGVSRKLWNYLTDLLDSVNVSALGRIARDVSADALRDYLLLPLSVQDPNPRGALTASLPPLVNELAMGILEVDANDRIAELRSGDGAFLVNAALDTPNAHCLGADANDKFVACSLMRADVAGVNISVSSESVVQWLADPRHVPVDKILLNHTFGQVVSCIDDDELVSEAMKALPELRNVVSADWVYNKLCIDALSEKGKAASILVASSAQGKRDLAIRKAFVENGWIEAAIVLPKDAFYPLSSVQTVFLVLSKGNEAIKLVNAADIDKGKQCRDNQLGLVHRSHEDAQQILQRLGSDTEQGMLLSLDEMRERGYRLVL